MSHTEPQSSNPSWKAKADVIGWAETISQFVDNPQFNSHLDYKWGQACISAENANKILDRAIDASYELDGALAIKYLDNFFIIQIDRRREGRYD